MDTLTAEHGMTSVSHSTLRGYVASRRSVRPWPRREATGMPDRDQSHEERIRMFRQLVDLAVNYHHEAVACAQAGCYSAASLMIGAALEAELLVMTMTLERELKAAQHWPSRKDTPETWGLHDLVDVAIKAGWLPAQIDSDEDIVTQDDVRNMLTFVKEIRNLIAHPGRYVRKGLTVDQASYQTAYDIVRTTFDYTYAHLKTLTDR